jgi:hypothetical protein
MMAFGFWDIALLVLVSAQATALAYVRTAPLRAFITALPIPFTLAALAVGRPVDASNVAAVALLLFYALAVRVLHKNAGVPIIPSIVAAAVGYGVTGAFLKSVVPPGDLAFWAACVLSPGLTIVLRRWMPRTNEPDHHHPLPPWLKFPAVAAVIFGLILLKRVLGGFMTMFPMVGVFAAYEGRFRLDAFCRAFDAFAFAIIPLLAAVRILQPRIGLAPALAAGWLVHIPVLLFQIREPRKAPSAAVGTAETPVETELIR